MYKLAAVTVNKDNYVWILSSDVNQAIIVDPGEAEKVITYLREHHYKPVAILLTHYHHDHIGGIEVLHHLYPGTKIYGPSEVVNTTLNVPVILVEGNTSLSLPGLTFDIIPTPGHTTGHVSYYTKPYLFCGDVLFSGGCGRIFEGTSEQMFTSLSRLSGLDNKTLICSAHEYTLDNLKFAHHILPEDFAIKQRLDEVCDLRKKGEMTLPTTLALEKKINLFLRCNEEVLKKKFNCQQPNLIFTELRSRKDDY